MNNGIRYMMFGGVTFLMGLVVGAGTGLLLAPHSGDHTRRHLRALAGGIGQRANRIAEEATEAVNEVIEQGRRLVG